MGASNEVVFIYGKIVGCPLWQASLSPMVPPFAVAGDRNSGFI